MHVVYLSNFSNLFSLKPLTLLQMVFRWRHQIPIKVARSSEFLCLWGWRRPRNKSFFKSPVAWCLWFRKYSILNLRIVALRDTILLTYLVEKNVYPSESPQFEPFIYTGRCVHTHVFYLMSEKEALSSLSELQMFSFITGRLYIENFFKTLQHG